MTPLSHGTEESVLFQDFLFERNLSFFPFTLF